MHFSIPFPLTKRKSWDIFIAAEIVTWGVVESATVTQIENVFIFWEEIGKSFGSTIVAWTDQR